MNRCQHFNNLIKKMGNLAGGGNLPKAYKQVEYLQSSGAQYIKTGINNNAVTDFYIKYEALTINSNNYIFGAWDFTGRCFVSYSSTGAQYLGYRDTAPGGGTMTTGTVCELTGTLKPGTQNLYKDGVLQVSGTNSATITSVGDLYLYAVHFFQQGESIPAQHYVTGRIYRFTLYNNGAKILDFIPCYRKSDSKPGMYDIVTDIFRNNWNTGADFTVGAEVN